MKAQGIRAMQAEDRDAVVQFLGASDPWITLGYTVTDWNHVFCPIPQGRDSYVAEVDGRVAGIAIVRQKFLLGDYLELLGVAGWARQQGIGSQLLLHVEQLVFGRTKNLFACVSDFNVDARTFYKKMGYQEIGPIPNLLTPGHAEIFLRKTLGPSRI